MIEALSARREARLGSAGQGGMIYSQELLAVAKRIFWFGTPKKRSNSHCGFSPSAMTYASDDPAPGIFDQSS
jgi:hypothetical protein